MVGPAPIKMAGVNTQDYTPPPSGQHTREALSGLYIIRRSGLESWKLSSGNTSRNSKSVSAGRCKLDMKKGPPPHLHPHH
jgi:hypothetical protein